MIAVDDFKSIAETLLAKSRANVVNWIQDYDSQALEGVYIVQFPKSMIRILYSRPKTEPNFVELQLCNLDGSPVDRARAAEGEPLFPLFWDLYLEAHRVVTHWDEVLADVKKGIAELGKPSLLETLSKYGPPMS